MDNRKCRKIGEQTFLHGVAAMAVLLLLTVNLYAKEGKKSVEPYNVVNRPAVFKVKTDVVNDDISPIFATIDHIDNSVMLWPSKYSFEPGVYRSRFAAQEDSANRIVDDRGDGIGYFDTTASGYLDGADVRVYRIINEKLELVRRDRVADGGTVVEYWNQTPVKPKNLKRNPAMTMYSLGTTTVKTGVPSYSRSGVDVWWTVFAIDKAGNLSEPATPVCLQKMPTLKKRVTLKEITTKPEKLRLSAGKTEMTPPPAPKNFTASVDADGIVKLSWDEVDAPGVVGYMFGRSDTDPSKHRGVYLQLEGKAANAKEEIHKGDWVIVNQSTLKYKDSWISNRVAHIKQVKRRFGQVSKGTNWRLVKHAADTPVTESGAYYKELTLSKGEKGTLCDAATFRNKDDHWYKNLEDGQEYIMKVWLKADRTDCAPVVFKASPGRSVVGKAIGRHKLQPTTEWKRHEVRFTGKMPAEKTTLISSLGLQAVGPCTISVDNFRVYAADAAFLDYRPYQYKQLRETGMSALREHSAAVTKWKTYSMRQYLDYPGLRRYDGHMRYGTSLSNFLGVCEKVGMDPWQKIEWHMAPEEWLAMVEYIAAPYDPKEDTPETKPYAYMRYQQGRKQPWADAFDRIMFELSNETWNRMFFPWAFTYSSTMTDAVTGKVYPAGAVYALWHDYVADILRSSPYWSQELEDKYIHMLGGWSTSLFSKQPLEKDSYTPGFTYTRDMVHHTQSGELMTHATYNGGWETGGGVLTENSKGLFNVLSNVYQFQAPVTKKLNDLLALGEKRLGRPLIAGIYEAGPSGAMHGLNGAKVTKEQAEQQERVMKSKLSGTATIDCFLTRMRFRSKIEGYFCFGEGRLWRTHAYKCYGGQPHACFLPLQLFNHHTTGDMLLVETESTPTCDSPKPKRGVRAEVNGAPLAAAYAIREGDRVALYCISRKVAGYPDPNDDGYTPFTVELPFTKAEKVTLYRLTGKPTDHNIYTYNVKIEDVAIDPSTLSANGRFAVNEATCGDVRGLPPSEMYLYVFEGTDIGPEGRVLTREEVGQQPLTFVPAVER